MKILFFIDTLETGGAEKSLLDITSRFTLFEPVFMQLFPGEKLAESFHNAGIQVISYNFSPNYHFKKIANEIQKDVRQIDPVIIHSTLFRSDMVSRELSRTLGIPLINSFVNNSYGKTRYSKLGIIGKLKLKGIEIWDRSTAGYVDFFISNSETIKRSNAAALHIPLEKIKVIHRGRDLNKFKEIRPAALDAIRLELGLGQERVFLNISRLLERKGQIDLLRAFHFLVRRYPDSRLLIAGEGIFRKELEREVRRLKMEDKVQLLGNRQDVPELLTLADYFVFPSHFEGLPGALIEAMFARIPIIASDIPENLECVNTEMARFFPVGDIPALTDSLLQAIEHPDPEKMGRAYQYALAHFEINKIARQYERIYQQLLKRSI